MKKRIIVINYDVKEGKISQINVHYNGQNTSINDENMIIYVCYVQIIQ